MLPKEHATRIYKRGQIFALIFFDLNKPLSVATENVATNQFAKKKRCRL